MNQMEHQYRSTDRLNTRISIHEKYSVNPQPFHDWLMQQYSFQSANRILEVGSGTGALWENRLHLLPPSCHLTVSDTSLGMLDTLKQKFSKHTDIDIRFEDIQSLSFPKESFDIVIANMMLYHVPDLPRALSEVRRVLKPGGMFYCATYGEHGIMEYINETLQPYGIQGEIGKSFTLQNGEDILSLFFSTVEKRTRDDGLKITHIPDFVDYVLSLSSLTGIDEANRSVIEAAFLARSCSGVLHVPKEYGTFLCKKDADDEGFLIDRRWIRVP